MKRSPLKRKTPLKRGGKLRKTSSKRRRQNEVYKDVREKFLCNNPVCQVCLFRMSSQVHHRRGRFGDRLNEVEYFLSVCFECHHKIHQNPQWAYRMGYMISR
jgi:5-methylcytosine-specific restriction endonuclease McrA